MPTYFDLTCQFCQRQFKVIARRKYQKFCSPECCKIYRKQTSQPKESSCLNCQAPLKNYGYRFCCQSCAAKYNNARRTEDTYKKQRVSLLATLDSQGKRRADEKDRYKIQCAFRFSPYTYPSVPGYDLLLENGMWSHRNTKGVVRDHILSREYGWRNNIPPEIISHPVNCRFLSNIDNARKGSDSHMSLDELLRKIKEWEQGKRVSTLNQSNCIRLSSTSKRRKKSQPINQVNRVYNGDKYQYTLQNKVTQEIVTTMRISAWLSERKLSTGSVYHKNGIWQIISKIKLSTGEEII